MKVRLFVMTLVAVMPAAASADYRTTILGDSPVGYWRLGEAAGAVAASEVNGHDGTIVNNPTLGQPGAPIGDADTAIDFERLDSTYIQVPGDAAFRTPNISVEAWVNPESFEATAYNVVLHQTSANAWNDGYGLAHLHPGVGGQPFTGVANNISFWVDTWNANVVTATVPLGTWSHVVGTYDGVELRIYVDGALKSSKLYAGGIGYAVADVYIGDSIDTTAYVWDGLLDEVAVYPNALTPAQVANHYHLGVANYRSTVLADDPFAYWRLGEAVGPTVASEVYAYSGTVNGPPTFGQAGAIANDADTALDFERDTNARIDVLADPFFEQANITVEAWVNPESLLTDGYNVVLHAPSQNAWADGFGLAHMRSDVGGLPWTNVDDNIVFWVNQWNVNAVMTTLQLGTWQHVVGTYDGADLRIYVDGVEQASVAFAGGIDYDPGNHPITIGDSIDVGQYEWDGLLDEVAVYGSALSPARIAAHHAAGVAAADAVELLELGVRRTGGGVEITWVTAVELATVGFEVWRATANAAPTMLDEVGFVAARGGLAGASYTVFDSEPPKGDVRYILHAHDTDGSVELFGPVTLEASSVVARWVDDAGSGLGAAPSLPAQASRRGCEACSPSSLSRWRRWRR